MSPLKYLELGKCLSQSFPPLCKLHLSTALTVLTLLLCFLPMDTQFFVCFCYFFVLFCFFCRHIQGSEVGVREC